MDAAYGAGALTLLPANWLSFFAMKTLLTPDYALQRIPAGETHAKIRKSDREFRTSQKLLFLLSKPQDMGSFLRPAKYLF
ncbi:hypothetical protein [Aliiroseovarius crassostreae]|uniref:hypothetical protein n=1 Tax=Aliiroseovarius crassostreae TaxID=154981 RepID=UPI0021FA6C17|nr:hypothetical protein [Aliiroseovarius crassostreae]UWQ04933.1 hypothetical protein K3X22_00150 [Aliiroseovarius crassostreae]